VFQKPKYLQNSFIIVFSRKTSIRKNVFDFEAKLEEWYKQPQVISVPDEISPDTPRMIFTSKHGHSEIHISQLNFVLNVNYSLDWQFDIYKSKEYILNEVSILYELLNFLGEESAYFCGFTTVVNIPTQKRNNELLAPHIYNLFCKEATPSNSDIYEFQLRTSKVIEKEFFSNINIQNYRTWNFDGLVEGGVEGIAKMSNKCIVESGIQIVVDFNNRYAFNEREDYFSLENQAQKVINLGLDEVNNTIQKIIGD
jgi:hypothetical protein